MVRKYELMGNPDSYISWEDADRIISICKSQRDRLIFRLLSRSGRRISEIMELKYKDIRWDNQSIKWHIKKKKDKAYTATIPQDEETMKMLRDWVIDENISGDEFIFKSYGKHGHLTERRVAYLLVSYTKKLGINDLGGEKIHPHMFRHGFAIHKVLTMKSPYDIFTLQKIMCHSDIRETMWYLDHFGENAVRKMMGNQ
jgi:integrase/recombinase XerD